jgi:hypothetical protein
MIIVENQGAVHRPAHTPRVVGCLGSSQTRPLHAGGLGVEAVHRPALTPRGVGCCGGSQTRPYASGRWVKMIITNVGAGLRPAPTYGGISLGCRRLPIQADSLENGIGIIEKNRFQSNLAQPF